MRIQLRISRVEQGYPVDAIAISARSGIVVVFAEEQIRRTTLIGRNHVCRNDRSRVVPSKTAGRLLGLKVGAEMQEESSRRIAWIGKDSEEYIAIRSNRR